jgi:hypothetical protein
MRARLLHESVLLGGDCLRRMPLAAGRDVHAALCAVPLHSGRAAGPTPGCRAASGIGAMLQRVKSYLSMLNDTSGMGMEVCHQVVAWLNVCRLGVHVRACCMFADACRTCKVHL